MKSALRFILCLIWLCCSAENLFSQDLFFEVERGTDISPNTSIHGIAKDSLGYIWFGSWSGLYRFDGNKFDVFNHIQGDSLSVPNNRIRNLITDDNQQLWILTFDNKYVKYNYGLDYFRTIPDSLVPNNVSLLLSYIPNQLNRNKTIHGYGYYISGNVFTSYNTATGDERQYHSNLWQPGALTDDYITCFYIDNQNFIWLGSRSGTVYKVNTNRKPFNLYHLINENSEQPVLTSVRSILKTDNELWLGTNNDGMFIYKNGKLDEHHPYFRSKNEQKQIRALLEDKYGRIWVGGLKGISCYDPETQKSTEILNKTLFPDILVSSVYSLISSNDGNIWAGLYNGLVRINVENHHLKFYDFSGEIDNHSVMSLVEDQFHNLWIATEGAGIVVLCPDSIGNYHKVKHIDNTNEVGERLTGNLVYTLYEDQQGEIWAGTSEALNRIDPENYSVTSYEMRDGLQDQYISAITGDENGNIWIAHKKGISKFDLSTSKIYNYSLQENNMSWVFLDGACYNDTVNSTIFFGSREGYVSFNPDLINSDDYQPVLLFSKLYVSGIEVKPGKSINNQVILNKVLINTKKLILNNNNRSFSIALVDLNYENKNGDVIFYKLEGFDEDYVQTKHNIIPYSKIPSGNYTLLAYVATSDGIISDSIHLFIRIMPPWYATRVAYVIYVLLLLGVIYMAYRIIISRERLKSQLLIEKLNLEKQEEINKEKIDFFTNVSHELKTPLTLIVDPIKQLKNRHLSSDNKALYLELIERNVTHLSNLINQLLDFRKSETRKILPDYTLENGISIVRESVLSFSMMAMNRKIDLVFNSEIEELIGYYDRERLEKILLNLISNAFKYTPDGGRIEVLFSFRKDQNRYFVVIKDSGVGIKREALKTIFEPFNNEGTKPFYGYSSGMGLTITRNYVDILGGTIKIESDKNKGTIVSLSFPYNEPETGLSGMQNHNLNNTSETEDLNSTGPSVLIVEDNPDVLSYLAAELGDTYTLLSENNGEDGLKSAVQNIPDMIISDVMMPKMDGIAMCNLVKTNAKTSHIPVILLTAKGTNEDQIIGLKSGADLYIQKPFNVEVLKAQIKSTLGNRQKMQKQLAGAKFMGDIMNQNIDQDNAFLNKSIDFVKRNIENVNFNTEELAKLLEISPRQLYRKLKAVTGSTVQEFIVRIRMERASELLLTTGMTISEIAYKVGFTEPSNFSRTFSRHFGSSPSKYRSGKK
ncbi:two-component regulator propeller domain-containing protein [Saccharicrinis sp. FJH2]|uniref:hybrid sensor histidine kinase/response regulator transcription factor n=1 Tax=Saccharicrinis sp. FJH65 TaxID=3344659 RepID=UPI0035F4E83A